MIHTSLCLRILVRSVLIWLFVVLFNSRFFAVGSRRCYRCDSLNWACMLFNVHCNTQKDSEQSRGWWNTNAFSIPCRTTNEGPASPSAFQSTTGSTSSEFSHTPVLQWFMFQIKTDQALPATGNPYPSESPPAYLANPYPSEPPSWIRDSATASTPRAVISMVTAGISDEM